MKTITIKKFKPLKGEITVPLISGSLAFTNKYSDETHYTGN